MGGEVRKILVCAVAGAELQAVEEAKLVPGKGIEGDRYFERVGTFSELLADSGDFEVTLIEREEIDAFNEASGLNYSPGQFRRNIVTAGIRLNELVGKTFAIGETQLEGIRLCEPCGHLETHIGKEVMELMVHKAGLRAVIKTGGEIRVGDRVEVSR